MLCLQHACLQLCNMHVRMMLTCFVLQHACWTCFVSNMHVLNYATCMSIMQHAFLNNVDMLFFATCMLAAVNMAPFS